MRKIIILPEFASSHLLKCSIPNWIDVIEPDVIIINSGLFPSGPENKGHIDDEFRKKWCEKEFGIAGFDYGEVIKLIQTVDAENRIIVTGIMHYERNDANECFLEAISTFHDFEPERGDIVLPLEPDVLFHENDKQKIQEELSRLVPGDGIQVIWKDFLETQFYVEAINEVQPKWRRFAYCWDNLENYQNAMNAFMTQNYKSLRKVNQFIGFHYPWWCPEPWKQLRFELIWRKDPQYWKDFENGLQEIQQESQIMKNWIEFNKKMWLADGFTGQHAIPKKQILIRPSRTDQAQWAKFINISHPKHIFNHPNFVNKTNKK